MDKKEAKTRFAKADKLFVLGRYEDALDELDAIEGYYPDNHRILNAQARTLERLRQYDRAMAICDRLLNEFQYEKIRPLRENIAVAMHNVPPPLPQSPPPTAPPTQKEKHSVDEREPRFKIKPIRLLILLALCAGMYFGYVPIWLGAGLIVFYFVVKLLVGAAIRKLFSAPFKMKGKALAGATCVLHHFEWTERPHEADWSDDEEEEEEVPTETLRYVWLDLTITPQANGEGFTYWEPGELMLAPGDRPVKGLDDLEHCYPVEDVKLVQNGQTTEDEDGKYAGPQRLKLLAGIPHDQHQFALQYYFEQFGNITLTP